MSKGSPTFISALNGVMRWTGKASLGFLILSLIILAVTMTLADPGVRNFDGTGNLETIQEFTLNQGQEVQVFFGADDEEATIILEKIEVGSNSQSNEYSLVWNITSSEGYRSEYLDAGEYRFQSVAPVGTNVWLVHAHFNLGLVIVTAVFFSIFGIIFSVFWTVLPFWIFFMILNSIARTKTEQPLQSVAPPVAQHERNAFQSSPNQSQTSPKSPTTFYQEREPSKSEISNFLSKLTRREIGFGILAIIFFFSFFAAPGSPFFVFAIIIAGVIAWSVSEREKMKGQLSSILKIYPNASVSFLSQQLDKKEDQIVKVLRMMILDDGYPIKLDLVNQTVHKIGKFPEEFLHSTESYAKAIPDEEPISQPSASSSSETQEPLSESVTTETDEPSREASPEIPTKTTAGLSGEVREPMLYCSTCGEGLKAEVKYCYICGARQ